MCENVHCSVFVVLLRTRYAALLSVEKIRQEVLKKTLSMLMHPLPRVTWSDGGQFNSSGESSRCRSAFCQLRRGGRNWNSRRNGLVYLSQSITLTIRSADTSNFKENVKRLEGLALGVQSRYPEPKDHQDQMCI